jgi:hypothetical protein
MISLFKFNVTSGFSGIVARGHLTHWKVPVGKRAYGGMVLPNLYCD